MRRRERRRQEAVLAVLGGKEGVQEGRPVPAGPEEAAAAGLFGVGASGERLHRAVWHLIAEGALAAGDGRGAPTLRAAE